MTENASPENQENPQQIRVQCPQPLSNDEFRSRILAETKNQLPGVTEIIAEEAGLDPVADAQAVDNIILQESLSSLYKDIAEARLDGDNSRLQEFLIFAGFYDDDEIQSINTLRQYQQEDTLNSVIVNRIAQVDDMKPATLFLQHITECESAEDTLQLDSAFEKIEDFANLLPSGTKSKIYFNTSRQYRRLQEKEMGFAANQELYALKRTLFYADEYKIINACNLRLKPQSDEKRLVTIAYKRAIKATANPRQLYKLHNELGEIYKERGSVAGYRGTSTQKDTDLSKAAHHYSLSVQYASDNNDKLI